jgi:DNA polymerase III epsilon subunit-like protein
MPPMLEETYISVDIETAGPVPGQYAMLSIGACLVEEPSTSFYVELQPDRTDFVPEALAIGGLSLTDLQKTGVSPKDAMQSFEKWVQGVTEPCHCPIFVALNAPFDWMFVNDYFHRYLGHNPFGHSALDIKAYFMGQTGVDWGETSLKHISEHFLEERRLTHNALADAQDQADIFRKILEQSPRISRTE